MIINFPIAFIGIDPGKTGAAALLFDDGTDYFDFNNDPIQVAKELKIWKKDFQIQLAVLEAVHSMPKQGVKSTFSMGHSQGYLEGILAAFLIPYIKEPPQVWQKGLVRPSDGPDTKTRALAVARRLFPTAELNLKKHHNRADALLMAYHARRLTNIK